MNFITIGTFDGVHLGHRRLLAELALMSRAAAMKSLALYFPVPPRAVIS
ncbi:MAG: riboflavin biosynthesis protein RibF, partial [Elusimicrobia bacterium]|nr:riboflavin biosynthesis protein RibF [Elusimicrobiota bacterium]